jgi:hypothetical protein
MLNRSAFLSVNPGPLKEEEYKMVIIVKKKSFEKYPLKKGELWHHSGDKHVYMCIDYTQGSRVFEGILVETKDTFYSVDLSTGTIVHTGKNSGDIEKLEQKYMLELEEV